MHVLSLAMAMAKLQLESTARDYLLGKALPAEPAYKSMQMHMPVDDSCVLIPHVETHNPSSVSITNVYLKFNLKKIKY